MEKYGVILPKLYQASENKTLSTTELLFMHYNAIQRYKACEMI